MRIVFLTVGFAIALNLSAQESRQELTPQDIWQAGLPYIAHYTPEDYRAHVQNWNFIQDGNGILYVGNTSGILEFDGVSWRLLAFPNGSPAKSFAKSNDNIIYVGAVRDFGYLQPDSVGLMQFHSLLSQLDTAYHNFADIWFTYAIGDAVYFISDAYIFRWQENKFKVWEAEEGFGFASQVNDQLYIDKKGTGLMRMQDDSLVLIPDGDKFLTRKGSITIMLPYEGDKILMGHFYEGLFLYDHQTISPFKAEKNPLQDRHIYSGLALPSGHFVFAYAQGRMTLLNTSSKKTLLSYNINEKGAGNDMRRAGTAATHRGSTAGTSPHWAHPASRCRSRPLHSERPGCRRHRRPRRAR